MADSQRTEKATPRRIEQARREGRFVVSREAVGALQFLALASILAAWGAGYCAQFLDTARYLLRGAFSAELTAAGAMRMLHVALVRCFGPLAICGAAIVAVTLAAQLAVTRMGFSTKGLTPDAQRLNPFHRLRELPRKNLPALVEALVLVPLFGFVLWGAVRDNWDALLAAPLEGVPRGAQQMALSLQSLLWKAAAVFVLLGAVDFWRQTRRYAASLRMTKHEVRQEAKEMEGDPRVRARIRQLLREWSGRRTAPQAPKTRGWS